MGLEIGLMTLLQIGATAASVGGAAIQYQGAKDQAAGSKKAEKLRKQHMELESSRKQRNLIRQAQIARSTALTRTTAQGASEGSALPGSYGQIESDLKQNLNFERKSLDIGRGIFDANAQAAEAGASAAFGSSIMGIGSAVIRQSGPLNDMAISLFGGDRSDRRVSGRRSSGGIGSA